jgi:hypothetical protein
MAKMTRQHFQFIADTIKDIDDPQIRGGMARLFADRLRMTNPGFDRDRFVRACGITPALGEYN